MYFELLVSFPSFFKEHHRMYIQKQNILFGPYLFHFSDEETDSCKLGFNLRPCRYLLEMNCSDLFYRFTNSVISKS